jgi:hypothetical protein
MKIPPLLRVILAVVMAIQGAGVGAWIGGHRNAADLDDLSHALLWGGLVGSIVGLLVLPWLVIGVFKFLTVIDAEKWKGVPVPRKILWMGAILGAAEGFALGIMHGQWLVVFDGTVMGAHYGFCFWRIAWQLQHRTSYSVLSLFLGSILELGLGGWIHVVSNFLAREPELAWLFAMVIVMTCALALSKAAWQWWSGKQRSD